MKSLKNKTVVITGGSRGIGLATAILFAEDNYNVVICARHDKELQQAKEKIIAETENPNVLALAGDVSQESFVKTLFTETYQEYKSVDVCVNNAGFLQTKPFPELTLEEWNSTIAVNATAVFLCCKEAFLYMKDPKKKNAIVNVSSLSGIRGVEKFTNMTAYIASKHAVVGLTESLVVEGKPFNISVNCVAPGAVDTELFRKNSIALKATTQPKQVASIIKFFAEEHHGEMINGTIFEYFCN